MASVSPFLGSRSDFSRNSTAILPESGRRILRFRSCRRPETLLTIKFRVCCRVQDEENKSNGEEPPESLFMKELRKRGMTPTSLVEDSKRSVYAPEEELKLKEDDKVFSRRSLVSTNIERDLSNQRERSMALNSEGLEGLIPRAKLLLNLGGTFFLAFGPLILTTVAFFSALYFYFGPTFIHDGNNMSISPPPYVDPYALLEEERMSQVPFRK